MHLVLVLVYRSRIPLFLTTSRVLRPRRATLEQNMMAGLELLCGRPSAKAPRKTDAITV